MSLAASKMARATAGSPLNIRAFITAPSGPMMICAIGSVARAVVYTGVTVQ